MSNKLPWTRLNAGEWMNEVSCLSSTEKCIYVMLRLQMLYAGEPLLSDIKALAVYVGYPVKTFTKALDLLLLKKKIIRLEDGRLWNLDVELELNDSKEKSEAALKAANSRWHKTKRKNNDDHINESAYADCVQTACDAHRVPQCDRNASNNNINIYKKNNTNVLLKKEIDFEDLETEDQDHDVENSSDQIELVADDQTSIHEKSSETSYAAKNLWHIDEKELEKLPSRRYTNSAKSLADVIGDVLPPTIHKQESVPKKSKKRKVKKDFKTLPEDFEPDLQYAIDQGLTHDEALLEFERFKFHWKANPCRNANNRDWQSAWCGWIINQNGTLAKKLEQEKRYANERYKLST
ncbi:DUF1376 domain-containing protein, partial [Bartonella vinsonii]|uniref:DUF1376 domain-containing protein n=1 Tax=Bartonella vinsonii TaxID=33047 RepID=UPI001ABB8604